MSQAYYRVGDKQFPITPDGEGNDIWTQENEDNALAAAQAESVANANAPIYKFENDVEVLTAYFHGFDDEYKASP